MFRNSTNTASFFCPYCSAHFLILSGGTCRGADQHQSGGRRASEQHSGSYDTVSGLQGLVSNTIGDLNTASGFSALAFSTTDNNNTAIGFAANVSAENLNNATTIGSGAIVNTSNQQFRSAWETLLSFWVTYFPPSSRSAFDNIRRTLTDTTSFLVIS